MNYEKAYELASSIEKSHVYQGLKVIIERIERKPEVKRMLDDFRRREMELHAQQMSGQMVGQGEWERLRKHYETLMVHDDIRQLIEIEGQFQKMYEDIQKIIAEPIQRLYSSQT